MSRKLRFAVLGTGFWAKYQIPAWMELEGIELVALYNRTRAKAETLAHTYGISSVYDDAQKLLDNEKIDFVDIITDVDSHAALTLLAAEKGVGVICQKPMAPKLHIAQEMVSVCERARVPFFIHENWRWQAPMRKVKEVLNSGVIGKVFKSRVTFCSAFPVFENQAFLAELDEFILTDMGSHILDTCRFLFGEVESLLCQTTTVKPTIKGEDVANVFMKMRNGISCYVELSYASILEYEPFPQTFVLIEGEHGSIHLQKDYAVHVTTRKGTDILSAKPEMYSWLDPRYALVHSSIVDCNRDILKALQGTHRAETTGIDNLETVKLVHAAYASAKGNKIIDVGTFG